VDDRREKQLEIVGSYLFSILKEVLFGKHEISFLILCRDHYGKPCSPFQEKPGDFFDTVRVRLWATGRHPRYGRGILFFC
jgi:hypothetical protein